MKASIVTVCYNSELTIKQTIESVISQKQVDLEYIIVDGLSTDSTMQIVNKYKIKHKNIISISERDEGIYDAMNKGIKIATGDIIGILNSDDTYSYNMVLHDVVEAFVNQEIDCCYGNILYIKDNKPYRYWKAGRPRTFKYGWMPPHSAFFVKKSVYEKYGIFRLDCGVNADYELMLRILELHKARAMWIDKTLVFMRAGGRSNNGFNSRIDAIRNDRFAWEILGFEQNPYTIWLKKLRKLPQYIKAKLYFDILKK